MFRKNPVISWKKGTPRTVSKDQATFEKGTLPSAPFRLGGEDREGSLLLFVPRNVYGTIIDLMTGRYGYSHLAIDCGEVDIASGKRVMIEVTVAKGVHNSFQDEYGDRKFARVPLKKAGVEVSEFCDCIRAKLGEEYDGAEALTRGLFHNPAKQICNDLATVCLPDEMRIDIARHHRAGLIHPLSAVRIFGNLKRKFRLFVSPNGFAEYFGAPKGLELSTTDQLSEPVATIQSGTSRRFTRNWKLAAAISISLGLAWLFFRRTRRRL